LGVVVRRGVWDPSSDEGEDNGDNQLGKAERKAAKKKRKKGDWDKYVMDGNDGNGNNGNGNNGNNGDKRGDQSRNSFKVQVFSPERIPVMSSSPPSSLYLDPVPCRPKIRRKKRVKK